MLLSCCCITDVFAVDGAGLCHRWIPHHNVEIIGGYELFFLKENWNVHDCQHTCEEDDDCVGINYDHRFHRCWSLFMSAFHTVNERSGFTYYYRNKNCPIGQYMFATKKTFGDTDVYHITATVSKLKGCQSAREIIAH